MANALNINTELIVSTVAELKYVLTTLDKQESENRLAAVKTLEDGPHKEEAIQAEIKMENAHNETVELVNSLIKSLEVLLNIGEKINARELEYREAAEAEKIQEIDEMLEASMRN